MEKRLAELFCRDCRPLKLKHLKAAMVNQYGAEFRSGEVYDKIQELKLSRRIIHDWAFDWWYPEMTAGWVGPDGVGEYGA